MMPGIYCRLTIFDTGGMNADAIAEIGDAPRFVQGNPACDAITQAFDDKLHVVREGIGGIACNPSPSILQRLWQIPMVECRKGFDAFCQHSINEAIIKVQTRHVDGTTSLRQNAWPCN